MSRIVLLDPPHPGNLKHYHPPHLGLAYLASIAAELGHDVSVITSFLPGKKGQDECVRETLLKKPDIIGISALTQQIINAHRIAVSIRSSLPEVLTVLGGWHFSGAPMETMEEFSAFDLGIAYDGESTWKSFLQDDSRDFTRLAGGVFRNEGKVQSSEHPHVPTDPESLPFPGWHLFEHMNQSTFYSGKKRSVCLPVIASRGCPFDCRFCQAGFMRQEVRSRSIGSILSEIEEHCINRFQANQIIFFDANFTLNPDQTLSLCDAMNKRGLNEKISWLCETRLDLIDINLARAMKKAGCTLINFGVETGDPAIQHDLKGFDLDKAVDIMSGIRSVGIQTDASFILGHPEETPGSALKTVRYATRMSPDFLSFPLLIPFVGTRIRKMAHQEQKGMTIMHNKWEEYSTFKGGVLKVEGISTMLLKFIQLLGLTLFYSRPSKIRNLFYYVDVKKSVMNVVESIFPRAARTDHPKGSCS